jgi:hypothetical protein
MKTPAPAQPYKAWYVPKSTATTNSKRMVATNDDGQNGRAPNLPVAVVHRN